MIPLLRRLVIFLAVLVLALVLIAVSGGIGYSSRTVFRIAESTDESLTIHIQDSAQTSWGNADVMYYSVYGAPYIVYLSGNLPPGSSASQASVRATVQADGAQIAQVDEKRMLRFVEEDSRHWADVAVPELQAQGFLKGMSRDDVLRRAIEIAEETRQELEGAALLEVEIQDSSHTFDAASIERAWEPTYLSADGTQLLEDSGSSPATAQVYRVIFWVHGWNDRVALTSPFGPIPLALPSPMPERLWRLAPSVLVD